MTLTHISYADQDALMRGAITPEEAHRRAAARLDAENARLRRALTDARDCMKWCIDLGADNATAQALRRGIAVIDPALRPD